MYNPKILKQEHTLFLEFTHAETTLKASAIDTRISVL